MDYVGSLNAFLNGLYEIVAFFLNLILLFLNLFVS